MGNFQKLTRARIKSLTAGAKITEQGISFERLSGGDGVYSVNIWLIGSGFIE